MTNDSDVHGQWDFFYIRKSKSFYRCYVVLLRGGVEIVIWGHNSDSIPRDIPGMAASKLYHMTMHPAVLDAWADAMRDEPFYRESY